MSAKSDGSGDIPVFDDDDIPEISADEAAQFQPMADDPAHLTILERARRLRGPQKAPKKEQIAIRLAPDIVAHFRATGPGWHGRINAALRAAMQRG